MKTKMKKIKTQFFKYFGGCRGYGYIRFHAFPQVPGGRKNWQKKFQESNFNLKAKKIETHLAK